MKNIFKRSAISLCLVSCFPAIGVADYFPKSEETVDTLSNDAGKHEVLAFQRTEDEDHSIGVYTITRKGALKKLESLDTLPVGVTGHVVR